MSAHVSDVSEHFIFGRRASRETDLLRRIDKNCIDVSRQPCCRRLQRRLRQKKTARVPFSTDIIGIVISYLVQMNGQSKLSPTLCIIFSRFFMSNHKRVHKDIICVVFGCAEGNQLKINCKFSHSALIGLMLFK
jgi:hypothetical protein